MTVILLSYHLENSLLVLTLLFRFVITDCQLRRSCISLLWMLLHILTLSSYNNVFVTYLVDPRFQLHPRVFSEENIHHHIARYLQKDSSLFARDSSALPCTDDLLLWKLKSCSMNKFIERFGNYCDSTQKIDRSPVKQLWPSPASHFFPPPPPLLFFFLFGLFVCLFVVLLNMTAGQLLPGKLHYNNTRCEFTVWASWIWLWNSEIILIATW